MINIADSDDIVTKHIVHLSHTDLDGYGCQFITNSIFKDITFFNANYHEIDEILDNIFSVLTDKSLLLITDLNLTIEQASKVHKKSKEIGFDIQLIDHHITGLTASKTYEWYYLNTDNSATYLTYSIFREKIEEPSTKQIVYFINIYDMWRKEDIINFQKATLLSDIIFKNKIDSNKDIFLKIKMIYFVGNMLIDKDTLEVESHIPKVLANTLASLTADSTMRDIMMNDNICSSYKMSVHPANDLSPFYSSTFKDKLVIFYKDISSSTFQYSSDFLLNKETYKDYILVNINEKSGNISIRSKNKQANQLAIVFGGGGHPDAAGANIKLDDRSIVNILKEDFNLK